MAKHSQVVFKHTADSMSLSLYLSQCQSHSIAATYTQTGMENLAHCQHLSKL